MAKKDETAVANMDPDMNNEKALEETKEVEAEAQANAAALAEITNSNKLADVVKAEPLLGTFLAFTMSDEDKAEIMEDMGSIGGEITRLSLPKIKVPSGGGKSFDMPDGTATDTIRCIILAKKDTKAYYVNPDTLGTPPDCSSEDGIKGSGIRRADQTLSSPYPCAKCRHNVWGTAQKGGNGKACQDRLLLAVLLEGSIAPYLLNVPPASNKVVSDFIRATANSGSPLQNFIVTFGLDVQKNAEGKPYSKIRPMGAAQPLKPEAKAPLRELRKQAKAMLDSIPKTQYVDDDEFVDAEAFEPEKIADAVTA